MFVGILRYFEVCSRILRDFKGFMGVSKILRMLKVFLRNFKQFPRFSCNLKRFHDFFKSCFYKL